MTIADFLTKVREYYGAQYSAGQREDILAFLQSVPEPVLPHLWEETKREPLYRHPLPIVEHLTPALRRAQEAHEAALPDPMREKARLALEYRDEEGLADPEEAARILGEVNAKLAAKLRFQ